MVDNTVRSKHMVVIGWKYGLKQGQLVGTDFVLFPIYLPVVWIMSFLAY